MVNAKLSEIEVVAWLNISRDSRKSVAREKSNCSKSKKRSLSPWGVHLMKNKLLFILVCSIPIQGRGGKMIFSGYPLP